MENRKVNFHGTDINIVNDKGHEYVAIRDILDFLGLERTNEYARIRSKFNTQSILVENSKGRLATATGLPFGELEPFLYSFVERTKGFKPPEGFWEKLSNCRDELYTAIYSTQPSTTIVGSMVSEIVPDEPEPENESKPEIESNPEPESKPEQEQQEAKPKEEKPESLMAFPLNDSLKRVVSNAVEANQLQMSMLEELDSALKEILDSEYILLDNK